MLEKTIAIGDKQVKFRSSATIPRLYRAKFKRDIFKDLSRLESSYKGNTDCSGTGCFHFQMAVQKQLWCVGRLSNHV